MKIEPIGHYKKRNLYLSKVGTGPSNIVAIKRIRDFHIGQMIQFVELSELKERSSSCTPRWHGGKIDDIRNQMLFISRW